MAIGFGPTERASDAIFSVALYPRWVNLFFLQGRQLRDPHGLLKGGGSTVRRIKLETAGVLNDPRVIDLMDQAVRVARVAFNPAGATALVIKSVSAKQRPRKPV